MFNKNSHFPAQYVRDLARWVLTNRKDVAARVATINAELVRIGFIRIEYAPGTENKTGFSVVAGSTIERLVRAYIVQGNSPLQISPFKMPEDGVVAPLSAAYNEPLPVEGEASGFGAYPGGFLNTDRYYPKRMGGRINRGSWDSDTLVRLMRDLRQWASQDMRTKVRDLEWRIIKQMDLREQLLKERDEILVQAVGGVVENGPDFDPDSFRKARTLSLLVDDLSSLLYEEGTTTPKADIGNLIFTFPNKPSELVG